MTDAQTLSWLAKHGYQRNIVIRYGEWLGFVPGWQSTDSTGKISGKCTYLADDKGQHTALLRCFAGPAWLHHAVPKQCTTNYWQTIIFNGQADVLGNNCNGPGRFACGRDRWHA